MSFEQDDLANVFSVMAVGPTAKGVQVKPFGHSFVQDEFFAERPNLVAFRRQLPLRANVIVERKLDDSQWVVSADDPNAVPLRSKQLHFSHVFRQNEQREAKPADIQPARDFLHKNTRGDVYRVRVVKVNGEEVSVRLIDFAVYDVVCVQSLYEMTEDFVQGVHKFAFAGRINLPPRSVTDALGLPDRDLVEAGDRLEIVLLSAVEPHLAVFGFSQSISRRILIDEMTQGLTDEEAKQWVALMRGPAPPPTPVDLPMGFPRMQRKMHAEKQLATVVAVEQLNFVRVRDLPSNIRLAFMKGRLQDLYSNERYAKALRYGGMDDISIGMGCVVEHPETKAVFRVQVLGVKEETKICVRPIDNPDVPPFYVNVASLFRPIAAISFARQVFTVEMTRHSKGILRFHLSQLAACLLPGGTPVVLQGDTKTGLTAIYGTNALQGVLEEIGFNKLGEHHDEEYDPTEKITTTFGKPPVSQPRAPENVLAYATYPQKEPPRSMPSARSGRR